MGLVPDSIKDHWENIVAQLNHQTSGLGTVCQLVFDGGFASTSTVQADTIGSKPKVMIPVGGRSNAFEVTGRELSNNIADSGGHGLKQNIVTKNIEGRIYPVLKAYEKASMGIKDDVNTWQFTTEKKYMPDIVRAREAIFNVNLGEKQIRVKLEKGPIPYGLGRAFQCKSIWIEI